MSGKIRVRIPDLMKTKGKMTASDLMHALQIAYPTAHRLSKGKVKSISLDMLVRLCDFFGVTPGDLFEYIPLSQAEKKSGRAKKQVSSSENHD